MAKGDSSLGLLSKMAKFVSNPLKDWSELEPKAESNSGYSKEALKEMIERKRQNDFVRKREFNYLRKLRSREPTAEPTQGGRPSYFQSSIATNPDDRAMTLRKIDEIEAQMSRQWWKGKHGDAPAQSNPSATAQPSAAVPPAPKPRAASNAANADAVTVSHAASNFSVTTAPPAHVDASATTQANLGSLLPDSDLTGLTPRNLSRGAASVEPPASPVPTPAPVAAAATFGMSRLYAVELADSLTDPDMEEAAIRFANGDSEGAEEGLLNALQNVDAQPQLAEAWMAALFDLYRATGQQASFESVGLEFANRFGRSAPAWFSTPELLANRRIQPRVVDAAQPPVAAPPVRKSGTPIWYCPIELNEQALVTLNAATKRSAQPWLLDWKALTHIDPTAVAALSQQFGQWCGAPIKLILRNFEALNQALRMLTPVGDKGVDPAIWQMRMDVLRLMRLHEEFETVALDYCVTYEVSPPSWQDPSGTCELEGADPAAVAKRVDAPQPWADSVVVNSTLMGGAGPQVVVELYGEIVNDASDALARLEAGIGGSDNLVISCAHLIRVDFSAAGSILNWVTTQQDNGCEVHFRDVNRIVAAFFNVIGINEFARVIPRST